MNKIKSVEYLSDFRFVLNESQIDLCVRFLLHSRPTNPITGCGVSNNSGGNIFASDGTTVEGIMTIITKIGH